MYTSFASLHESPGCFNSTIRSNRMVPLKAQVPSGATPRRFQNGMRSGSGIPQASGSAVRGTPLELELPRLISTGGGVSPLHITCAVRTSALSELS